jgi:hypothetical protein
MFGKQSLKVEPLGAEVGKTQLLVFEEQKII